MNIAFIVGEFPVLSEPFILNQISGLMDRGHDVHIYAVRGQLRKLSKVHPIFEDYGLKQRTVYFTPIPQNFFTRFTTVIRLLAKSGHLFSFDWLKLVNVVKYGRDAANLRLLYQGIPFLNPVSYDIIHAQFGGWGLLGLTLRDLGLLNGKLVTHFRGSDISVHLKKSGDHLYDDLLERGDFFLTNCEFFRQRILKLGCPPWKIRVHGSAIDCGKFAFTPRYLSADGVVRVATVGRLVEKKGIEYCIKAVASVAQRYPNIEFKIIGEGALRKRFEQLIQDLNAEGFIQLLGWKNQHEIIEILNDCHLFMAPSVTAEDGDQDAPVNTLKEAMAMGLPVISTWHGGIPELVEDGKSGYLVPERDAEAIAQKLIALIEGGDRWAEMGQAGRLKVEQMYDINRLSDELVDIYKSV
ncbi:MAG: glycosyltransferase [Elainellaceae cyanobacterium]